MVELRGTVSAVCQGANGRLFLGSQDGFNLDLFTGGKPFGDVLIQRWRATLAQRGRELAARGIPYIFFLVPDAPTVYSEDLPAGLQSTFRPPGEIFLEAMGDIPNVTFIYPLQALRQAKGGIEIYKKKDSHWTTFGSYIAYQEFMRHAAPLAPCRPVPARDVSFSFRRSYGDLGSQTDPEQSEDIPVPNFAGPAVRLVANREGAGRQTSTETHAEGDVPPARILFFRDSFMTDLSPYLARSYSDMLTLGSTTRVLFDAIDDWHPDLVVSEVAERKLFFYEPDHQADGFEASYHGEFRSPAGARLLRAILLRPTDPAAARALILDDLDAATDNSVHAYHAALIMESAGDIQAARDLIATTLQGNPDQPSFLALAARVSLAAGNVSDAVAFSACAADHAPYNGYFHELLTYSLVQGRNVPSALAAVGKGLSRVKDHPNLWYWASICHAAMGQPDQALAAIREALTLDPGNEAYIEQYKNSLRG